MEQKLKALRLAKKRSFPYNHKERGRCSVEFHIISSTKMKLRLSDDEIKKYSLSAIESDSVDSGSRKGLWQLIDIAKEKHGFSFGGEKLLVQFYKTDTGGELFITKLLKQSEKSERILESAENITLLREKRKIYRFTDADAVICAIRSSMSELPHSTELYFSDDGCYYLVFIVRYGGAAQLVSLCEYGNEVDECCMASVTEHSTRLGGAVELSELLN